MTSLLQVTAEFINGCALGIEHIDTREMTEELEWMVVIHFLTFRISVSKLVEQDE